MELRSTRSRSKTPFLVQNVETFDKELIERGNHVEKSIITTTTVKTSQSRSVNAKEELESFYNTKPEKKTRRSLRNKLIRTSDYSSEDGETELSFNKTISQNEKNQLIEDARAAANGSSEISALELYKRSGRYWDVYPKTDWTYSHHSRDRVELAPGVVAMPNMSRRTIHTLNNSSVDYGENVSHKNINTDDYLYESERYASESDAHVKRRLFNNNGDYVYYKKSEYRLSVWQRFKKTVTSVFTTILSVFYFIFKVHTSVFRYLHRLTGWVMLMDTYLLWKRRPINKNRAILLLCLVPLLLLGGWWLLFTAGSSMWSVLSVLPSYFNSKATESPVIPVIANFYNNYDEELLQKSSTPHEANSRTIIQPENIENEKIYKKPPTADEIAAGLSKEQLNFIAQSMKNSINVNEELNTDEMVQKIILSPSFQNIINNYNNVNINKQTSDDIDLEISKRQEEIINSLKLEIDNLKKDILQAEKTRKEELDNIILQLRNENSANNIRLTHALKRCCSTPIINIERYVNRILTNLLNNPEFLNNQKGLNDWLHSLFIAKEDLEMHLSKLTTKLDSKFSSLVEDNTKKLMDDVASKISLEMNRKINIEHNINTVKREATLDCLTDDHVKRIVRNTLATYDADKTGLVDYAMETMGGQIITTRCTENYHYGKAVVSVLGIPLWYPVNSPRTVITPSINPGECWAFQNFPGFVVIKLSNKINIEALSIEHISRLLVPEGKIDSAPKEFEVYGLEVENDKNPVLLGKYVYDYDGEPLQFFPAENDGRAFEMVELRVISNHGNPNYTCLYRFRVHGRLSNEHT